MGGQWAAACDTCCAMLAATDTMLYTAYNGSTWRCWLLQAKLWFDNVRVPRGALLNAHSDVAPDGTFHSRIAKPRDRFLKVRTSQHYGLQCLAQVTPHITG